MVASAKQSRKPRKKRMELVPAKDRLAANLRRIARKKNMTQEDIAEVCNMRQSNVSRVMTADLAIRMDTLDQLAAGLEVDAAELLLAKPSDTDDEVSVEEIMRRRLERDKRRLEGKK